MNIPKSINLANKNTKIEKLKISDEFKNKNIYIKRDDQTGTEISGNKIRKLEFSVQEALDQGATDLITCGGIQSNHARATVAVAAKLGLGAKLVLRGNEESKLEGNYFFDKLLGADIRLVTAEEYSESRMEIMESIKEDLEKEGRQGYIIPEGASNGIGSFGYYSTLKEIIDQEQEMNIKFDAIVATVGSGGTYAGLYYGNRVLENESTIYGINICDDANFFKDETQKILGEISEYTGNKIKASYEEIDIIDGYAGDGYGKSRPEEIQFIQNFAKNEGIILDPVYTGKAMYGFVNELKKGTFDKHKNILFIHTGGIFGWSEEQRKLII